MNGWLGIHQRHVLRDCEQVKSFQSCAPLPFSESEWDQLSNNTSKIFLEFARACFTRISCFTCNLYCQRIKMLLHPNHFVLRRTACAFLLQVSWICVLSHNNRSPLSWACSCWFFRGKRFLAHNPVDLCQNPLESFLDICRLQSWCLYERKTLFLWEGLCIFCRNTSQVLEIRFVAHQHDNNIRICMISQFLQPSFHILISHMLCDVINQQSTHSSSIVGTGDGPIPLLSCCVPNLGLDSLAINLKRKQRWQVRTRLWCLTQFLNICYIETLNSEIAVGTKGALKQKA